MPHSKPASPPRCAALVGPYLSGKTTLLESLLFTAGAVSRKGCVRDHNTVGDASPEARARAMSVETTVASCSWLDEAWTFLDCPGSLELAAETRSALMVADIAVVVCEPVLEKAPTLAPLFRFLDENAIPHLLFINKVESMGPHSPGIAALLEAFQAVSTRPLVLREVPIREGEQITGYVDLVSERAYHFNPHRPSSLIPLPDSLRSGEQEARQGLLETLADFDDGLLEKLLENVPPDPQDVYRQLTRDLKHDRIVPVFLGSAEGDNGVHRLFKALRHEAPEVADTAQRLQIPGAEGVVAQVFRTFLAPHTGKLTYVRVFKGGLNDGMTLAGERVSGIYRLLGSEPGKLTQAPAGAVVALGRLEKTAPGQILTERASHPAPLWPDPPPPLYALAVAAENRADEVKLTTALHRMLEEDAGLRFEQNGDTGDMILWGQGEIHLQIVIDRLRSRFNVGVKTSPPPIPYQETIRKPLENLHARFKRQSGGHGQFADIVIDIRPQERGAGFRFSDTVVGGAVPRQYIPAVEAGVRESLTRGPLGFPVVDVAVNLAGGQFHAVDSSEMAFKTVARQAMAEGLPKCGPVLLEPVLQIAVHVPTAFTAKAQRMISSRRGQILGFDARPGWTGWDTVQAHVPQSDMHDFILELRSATLGIGSFTFAFDHLAELSGRLADKAVEQRQAWLKENH